MPPCDLTVLPPARTLGRMNPPPDFAKWYDQNAELVLRVIARMGVSPVAVEDVAHDVWTEAWRKYETQFRGESFRAWIIAIARNRALDWLRRKTNRHTELTDDIESPAQQSDSPLEQLVAEEEKVALRDCFQQLDERLRTIVLSRLDGLSSQEIGEKVELSAEQVNRRHHSAKEQLKRCVETKLKDVGGAGAR